MSMQFVFLLSEISSHLASSCSCTAFYVSDFVEKPENSKVFSTDRAHMRNRAFCICENKGADQLPTDDQLLCFRYIESTIPLLPKLEFEQRHEKTNILHMRKQRRRSASR